ncbi:glutamyl-tRNA amidotransferase [Legionella norrlandica]|uniref:Aspartyl/glutamyl-tRNA(Asn/Gln) amidotransferase subunit C n=1 Tax=Legionella norrlandica TaxID=1498499 RepID=A0A0A2T933_9GAMM|nr:Asp-tRNA(Asn)/Glu-tRNA(Gln) amidotransferase subunit GatC [Legionella norrlandica]KGP63898.1 glutamyl-tRNA amidotransferase [Legionella norrlandica]
MTISAKDLEDISKLAYLNEDAEHSAKLTQEISAIMDFVDQLKAIDTSDVTPLFHPLALTQRLRPDEVTEAECLAELEAMAPLFEDNLYLVPKVISSDKS